MRSVHRQPCLALGRKCRAAAEGMSVAVAAGRATQGPSGRTMWSCSWPAAAPGAVPLWAIKSPADGPCLGPCLSKLVFWQVRLQRCRV